jgi:hypothetical protein
MAQRGADVRAKLNDRIFSQPPASSITITSRTVVAGSLSGYYGQTITIATATTTVGVPYNVTTQTFEHNAFGNNPQDGEMRLAVRYDADVESQDLLNIEAITGTYQVSDIKDYPYNGVNLCRILTIKQLLE